jgi:energy-coupling factor transporter transmembrane protein EcfT
MGVIYYQVSRFSTFLYQKLYHSMPYKISPILVIGAFEGLTISYVLQFLVLKFYCFYLGSFSLLCINLIVIALNSYYFSTLKNGKKILKRKPLLWKSQTASVFFTILFFCVCIFIATKVSWEVQDLLGQYRRQRIEIK